MQDAMERSVTVTGTIEEALATMRRGATILAGGTWIMRGERRGENLPDALVSLHRIAALSEIATDAEGISIGAAVTHDALANALHAVAGMEALAMAARSAANPAIRRVATVGGNLCTADFPAADLAPALLALDARVELATPQGSRLVALADFLMDRPASLAMAILVRVVVPRDTVASAHIRLPLRRAGDYPVAIVSAALSGDGRLRIAVGSVEAVARRWTCLEEALADEGHAGLPDPVLAAVLANAHNDFAGRDGIEAEGWYRREVLPALVRRAFTALRGQEVRA